MSAPERRRRRLLPLLLTIAAAVLAFGPMSPGVGDVPAPSPTVQPWLGVIDNGGSLIDASPQEAPGEVWSLGAGMGGRILRYTDAEGWRAMPPPLDAAGNPVDHLSGAGGILAGRATPAGSVVLLANNSLFVRDPGGGFREAPAPNAAAQGLRSWELSSAAPAAAEEAPAAAIESATPLDQGEEEDGAPTEAPPSPEEATPVAAAAGPAAATVPLRPGEQLYFEWEGKPLIAPLEEEGQAGAFVVPTAGDDGARDAVLRFDGDAWSREPICLGTAPVCEEPDSSFSVAAIDAAGADHAWLLATGTSKTAGVVLLKREIEAGDPVWRPVSLGSSPFALRSPSSGVKIEPRTTGQSLVATAQGVWADARVTVGSAQHEDATLFYDEDAAAIAASWCNAPAGLCTEPLGPPLGAGRSFAWDDGSSAFGSRLIVGLNQGAMLRLSGATFERVPTGGRGVGSDQGAAFTTPDDGWLGSLSGPVRYGGGVPPPPGLRQWPVPFRRPLTAIAPEPGKPIAAIDAQALAVGDQGEVARYIPGQGWTPESLYSATGTRATPRLRAVAWPSAESAYAVGDKGEMWLWRKTTGLWESDPGKPATASVAIANFTGIAFDPGDPDRGYAIGKQGVLLRYDKQWTQEPLPEGLHAANFTSIAFAGDEAIVTYKLPTYEPPGYLGGVIVNDGSGWREEKTIAAQLPPPGSGGGGSEPVGFESVPERVAGLPDGSAVVATMVGSLVERDGSGGAWHKAGLDPAGFPAALAAFEEGGSVRAIMAPGGNPGEQLGTDIETVFSPPPPGQAPVLSDPYPLSAGIYVLRQGATEWRSEQHDVWPEFSTGGHNYDLPERADPVLAFLVNPSGTAGWAVGGAISPATASVARYPDDGQAPPAATTSSPPVDPGQATFAVGGGAECLGPCADLGPSGAGPWRWLPAAVGSAGRTPGVRAFLDTGAGTAGPAESDDFPHEEAAAAQRLTAAAGALPVYAAPAPSDLDGGSLDSFLAAFGAPGPYYAFDSTGQGGAVRVIVLDTSGPSLGGDQICWLAGQLAGAATQVPAEPAIVVGNQSVYSEGDSAAAATLLASGIAPAGCGQTGSPAAASAYFYEAYGENREGTITAGGGVIPALGTGSLGYGNPASSGITDEPANSGYLLAQVDGSRLDSANRARVTARLIPNVGELAMNAGDGTLLRRSQVALFEGLARRPRAGRGCRDAPFCQAVPGDLYTPIPSACVGPRCVGTIEPEYTFTSSNPTVANFVARDPVSTNPRRMLFDAKGNPVPDATSGLLCAFNAGTTTVTLTTGGLTYSMPVTVQPGKVRRPCGTVPIGSTISPTTTAVPLAPFPGTQPHPSFGESPTPLPPPPPPPVAPTPAHAPPAKPPVPIVAPFLAVPTNITPLVPIVPPPPPPAAQTTPPSGTSPVTQPVTSPNPEDEEEAAIEHVHHMAALSRPGRPAISLVPAEPGGVHGGIPLRYLLAGLILLTALASASLAPRRRQPQLAHIHMTAPRRPNR